MPRDNDGTLPENHGKPWSISNENLLLKKISEGESVEDISIYFKRTNGGILSRLRELACRFVEDGKSIEEASTYTKISIEDIEKSIQARKTSDKTRVIHSIKKEDTLLSVAIEIRDLLKELLKK